MSWSNQVEQLRQYASWESRDIPTDLVLSIISNESGGQAGIKSYQTVKAAQVPNDAGQIVTANHALGLMQCIPSHINAWNQNRPTKITVEDMTGDDERAKRLQIRLGSSVFASCVNHVHKYDPVQFPGDSPGKATPEQLRLALVCYAAGPGYHGGEKGLIPRLDLLKEAGKPLTLAELTRSFPRWGYSETAGKWINRPLDAANRVWSEYQKNTQTTEPRKPRGPKTELPPKKKRVVLDSWIIPAVVVAAVLFFQEKWLKSLFES